MKSGMFGKTFFIVVAVVLALFAVGLSFFTLNLEEKNPRIQYVTNTVTAMPTASASATPTVSVTPTVKKVLPLRVVTPVRTVTTAPVTPSVAK